MARGNCQIRQHEDVACSRTWTSEKCLSNQHWFLCQGWDCQPENCVVVGRMQCSPLFMTHDNVLDLPSYDKSLVEGR